MFSRHLLFFSLVLTILTLAESAFARRLSNSDLRRFGYTGIYRGDVEGFIRVKDDDEFLTTLVSQADRESLPVRRRSVVSGPTRRNGFFLTLRNITGNDRRIVVRLYYSGVSYNPIYEEDMVGTGMKTMSVRRFAGARPQFEMSLIDRLQERRLDGGGIHTVWNIRGQLFKR